MSGHSFATQATLRPTDHHLTSAAASSVALRDPSAKPGATPLTLDALSISRLLLKARFNLELVATKIGAGALMIKPNSEKNNA
ncbi:hypothetical protein ACCAA_1190001 [Candidatus Accumulibacter aalborgensis]|uniref:Uncharacterized protein n=1 Tax=Candidatus Accumulibacter aalborgensis TaxID=1860102 RepID=A0A1A8XGR0_9PROT|nr:hypothetical protein ACCAA_1190001 [Candidatus Accumulibacter aalborgensis]